MTRPVDRRRKLAQHSRMDDLEPFLSEIDNEALPLRFRLGSLQYLEARSDFMTDEERQAINSARERLYSVLTEDMVLERPEPKQTQWTLF